MRREPEPDCAPLHKSNSANEGREASSKFDYDSSREKKRLFSLSKIFLFYLFGKIDEIIASIYEKQFQSAATEIVATHVHFAKIGHFPAIIATHN